MFAISTIKSYLCSVARGQVQHLDQINNSAYDNILMWMWLSSPNSHFTTQFFYLFFPRYNALYLYWCKLILTSSCTSPACFQNRAISELSYFQRENMLCFLILFNNNNNIMINNFFELQYHLCDIIIFFNYTWTGHGGTCL